MSGAEGLRFAQVGVPTEAETVALDGAPVRTARPDVEYRWRDTRLSDGNVTQVAATGASPYVGDGMAINRRQSPASSVTKNKAPMLIMCDTPERPRCQMDVYERWINWLVPYLK